MTIDAFYRATAACRTPAACDALAEQLAVWLADPACDWPPGWRAGAARTLAAQRAFVALPEAPATDQGWRSYRSEHGG